MNANQKRTWMRRVAAVCLITGGIAIFGLAQGWVEESVGTNTGATVSRPPSVDELVSRELGWAEQQTSIGLAPRLTPVREFFGEARQRTRAFAEDALGWDSKWKLVTDFATGKKEHAAFLEERFGEQIFTSEQLEQVVASSVSAYLRHLDDVDAELLVRLRADLADVSPGQLPVQLDRNAIDGAIRAAIDNAVSAVQVDFGGMVAQQIVSGIAGEVLGNATVQLATSAGILSAGASSGLVTGGVMLVVGIIIDQIITWIYEEVFDPAGELAAKVNGTLSELERLILTGNGNQPGLEGRLRDYAARRGQARTAAVRSVLLRSSIESGTMTGF